jgi:hypothetical protein
VYSTKPTPIILFDGFIPDVHISYQYFNNTWVSFASFLAVVVQTWVWSKDAMFGFSVPHREKLCAIIRVKIIKKILQN